MRCSTHGLVSGAAGARCCPGGEAEKPLLAPQQDGWKPPGCQWGPLPAFAARVPYLGYDSGMSDDWEPTPVDRPNLPPLRGATDQPRGAHPAVTPASAARQPDQPKGKAPLVFLALLSCVCAAVVIVVALSIAGSDENGTATAATPASLQRAATTDEPTTTTTEAPTTSRAPTTAAPTFPPTTMPPERQASLYSNFARLRGSPSLDGIELTTLQNRDGASVRVLGPHENGWYFIEVDGLRGWIFGAFVLPPDPDLSVAVTRTGEGAQLLNASGNILGITNSSGSKVIVIDDVGDLFLVLLPEGSTAYVAKSAVLVVG